MKLDINKNALIIVAHPDDETIWMGGTIMKNPNVNWTIFSLCRYSDKDRAPKFKKVCDCYKAKSIIADLDDENKLSQKHGIIEAEKILLKNLDNKKFDYIFTHGYNGEYGHNVHIQVNIAVNNILKNKILTPKIIFYFNYFLNNNKILVKKDSDLVVKLNKTEYKEKKRIVSEMYGYALDGIDVGYCINEEGFKIKKIK